MSFKQSTTELLAQATVDYNALDTLLQLVDTANEKSIKSKRDLESRIAMVFQVGINKNPEGLKVLQSRCAMATSDEPEEETFLEALVGAIIDVSLEKIPEKEQEVEQERVLMLIHSDAMKELNVSALQWVFTEIEKRLPIVVVIDVEGNAIRFFQKRN